MKKYWHTLLITFCFVFSTTPLYAEHKDNTAPAYNQQAASQVTQSFDKKKEQIEKPTTDGIQLDIKWLPWLLVFAGVANIVLLYSRIKDRKLAEMRKQKEAQHHHAEQHEHHNHTQTTHLSSSLSERHHDEYARGKVHPHSDTHAHSTHHPSSLETHVSSKKHNHL